MSQSNLLGTTLLRVSLGVMWTAHGLLKLLVFTLPGTAQLFQSVALVLGIYARQVSLALAAIMAAAASVHISNG
jgi:putative oxidoreductase